MNRTLETDRQQPRKGPIGSSQHVCWLYTQIAKAGDKVALSPSQLLLVQTTSSQPYPSIKTHSSSLLLHPPGFLTPPIPILLVDMKSLRTDTEVGFKVKFPPACVSKSSSGGGGGGMLMSQSVEQQSTVVVLTRKQGSRGERPYAALPCVSSSIMAIVCLFFRGINRGNRNEM